MSESVYPYAGELVDLLEDLCRIPAPSGREEKRASFIRDWILRECSLPAFVDDAANVLVEINCDNRGPVTLLMAHTDTVFPDLTPLPVLRTGNRIVSPGAGDNTACVAILMLLLKYKRQELCSCRKSVLFAFNSGEEGLGNLKGCRRIMETYRGRIEEAVSFDGGVRDICCRAVGSVRYQVSVRTRGGHSYNDFGNANAIEIMAGLIGDLYRLQVPSSGKNTYNVGTITGGTSVNTIAQSCSCLFEYRSDIRDNLALMDHFFHSVLEKLRSEHPKIQVEAKLLGERPCSGDVDQKKQQALTDLAADSIRRISGRTPEAGSGSTDCNMPLSLGIPAVCFGGLIGDGVHTREEYVDIPSLLQEARIIDDFLQKLLF